MYFRLFVGFMFSFTNYRKFPLFSMFKTNIQYIDMYTEVLMFMVLSLTDLISEALLINYVLFILIKKILSSFN